MEIDRKKYELSGGSFVEVHKVFGDEYYFAVVDQNGIYPEAGKVGKDYKRYEYLVVISGELTIWVNKVEHKLKANEAILINDGDSYKLDGVAKCIVFVWDKDKEAKTEIIDEAA